MVASTADKRLIYQWEKSPRLPIKDEYIVLTEKGSNYEFIEAIGYRMFRVLRVIFENGVDAYIYVEGVSDQLCGFDILP